MRCLFEDPDVTEAERDVVDAWLVATDCSGVTEITIEDLAVILSGDLPALPLFDNSGGNSGEV